MTDSHPYLRYVAIGDSLTEGIGDPGPAGGHRGWADRFAEILAQAQPGLTYANLAVRGKTSTQIRADQLGPALALQPDLVTVTAGMNDVVRPRYDPEAVAANIEETFARLTASGARVATMTFPDLGKVSPVARRVRPRIVELNARLRSLAARHGVAVLDVFPHPFTADPRLWSDDRLHASPVGHARIAAGMAHTFGLPGHDDWAEPLPPLSPVPVLRAVGADVRWAVDHVGPWLWRRLRGHVPGDGFTAKRPEPSPVTPRQAA
ncbi:SGNH/GDSL hydrolase family protein [Streptomyces guryensis]|uniref:SGNH/GDSL hydrolase family protein n=1 Tax=Streptomyces guryensis TaxID=2886947 RepID=A0A9Q3Z9U7_9ACTN|nr:SGNH/GDSL hydrolase family protein [Streptomyces guryensis]MCD9874695.1 SGNH/GDSL hydrolase family protein [Streptomyces guryensis]